MALNNNAININAGFELGSSQPIDSRLILTKAQMLAIDENIEPSNYLALCKDDGRLYIYNSANTIDVETGKFRPSNTVNIQYTDMPVITSDMVGQIVQYIGETTTTAPIYNKGCWYQAVATDFYAWKDSVNDVTVWANTATPNILDNVYDANLDPTANYVTDYLEALSSIILDDNNTYERDTTQDTASYHWEELTDSKLQNAILGYDFQGGKIWKGSSEDYEALDAAIKNNTNIIFMVYGASDSNWSIIDDDIVSGEKTMSSLKAYATFITANTNALVNYYKKTDTFSKTEILQMTSKNLQAEIVTSLPSTDISTSTIYLISASSGYDQWMYINGGWVKIGTTNIDLTDYATKTELNAKQDALTFDTEPTQGSSNPVTSGGIYNGIATTIASAKDYTDTKVEVIQGVIPSDASSSNKLVTSSTVASKTISGVTVTVYQGVGTITTTNFCQAGKVVIGRITITDATLTYHGNTTLILQLPNSVPQPMITVDTTGTYFDNNTVDTTCHCRLGSDRKIAIYSNSSDGESVANVDVWLTVIYIAQ